jgi:hypothetical protein
MMKLVFGVHMQAQDHVHGVNVVSATVVLGCSHFNYTRSYQS